MKITVDEVKRVLQDDNIEEYFEYLDWLRDKGKINMLEGEIYVSSKFRITNDYARKILSCWMRTFAERHSK